MATVDEVLSEVGGYRRFTVFTFIIISVSIFLPLASQGLSIIFIGFVSPHHCRVPDHPPLNESVPYDEHGHPERCLMYVNGSQNATIPCSDGWQYHPVYGEQTIVMEWDLVCEKNYLAELSQTIYQGGALVGELLTAVVADRFGRKWVGIVCYVVVAALGAGLAYTQDYYTFITLRALIAIFVACLPLVGMTHVMELVGQDQRVFAGIISQYGWSCSFFFVALLTYFLREWRTLQLVLSLTSLAGLICIVIPESPYWLAVSGRVDEAEKVLQRIARYNKVKVKGRLLGSEDGKLVTDGDPNNIDIPVLINSQMSLRSLQALRKHEERTSDLFKDSLMRRFLLLSMVLWFSVNLTYYFSVLGAGVFGGNLYLNFFLGGVVEFPGILTAFFIGKRGRRLPTCIFFTISGILYIIMGFTPDRTASGVNLIPLVTILVLAIRFCAACTFCLVILFTKEIFPTNLRGTGSGLSTIFGRVGNMLAPFAVFAARETPWLPNVSLSGICFITAGLTLLLPEPRNWPLPQTVADIHSFIAGKYDVQPLSSGQASQEQTTQLIPDRETTI